MELSVSNAQRWLPSQLYDKHLGAKTQITKVLGSMSIKYRSDAKVSDRYQIDVDQVVARYSTLMVW